MNSKLALNLCLLAAACLLTASCSVQSKPQPQRQPPVDLSTTSRGGMNNADAFDRYVAQVGRDLVAEKFSVLEEMATEARTRKERFAGGSWKLNAFYTGVETPLSGEHATQSEWQEHLARLRKWVAGSPNSITARVSLGEALVEYAWEARGQGYANTVSNEEARLFRERSEMAEQVLNEAGKLTEKCPHWYVSMLRLGLGMGWEKERFNRLFAEAVAFEPDYYYYYRIKAMYLLPRWYGEEGEWEKFAESARQQRGGREGAMLYYLIGAHIHSYYGRQFFVANQVSWARMKEGYEALEAAYGWEPSRMRDICALAQLAGESQYTPCTH